MGHCSCAVVGKSILLGSVRKSPNILNIAGCSSGLFGGLAKFRVSKRGCSVWHLH